MSTARKSFQIPPETIYGVEICPASTHSDHGILITFTGDVVVYYDAAWLFDNRECCGNFTLDGETEDE